VNTKLDIGRVGVWTGAFNGVPSSEAARGAGLLEELGYPTLWIPEGVGRDPFVTATLLLGATRRLRLATGIANIYARDAVTMANTQRALDEAFPDRFLLGLGVSHQHLVAGVRHHDYTKPYSRMVAYLDDLDAAAFQGVGPTDRGPTVLAALGPKMLRLAADRTAGAHPYFVPVEHTAEARAVLGPDALLAPEQMVVLEPSRERAHEIARAHMARYLQAPNYVNNLFRLGFTEADVAEGGSGRLVDAIVSIGGVEPAVARVRAHLEAGADHVCAQVLDAPPGQLPEAEWRELATAFADQGWLVS